MPYVTQAVRRYLARHDFIPRNTGELNYCITLAIRAYMAKHPRISYELFGYVVGTLEDLVESVGVREWHADHTEGLERTIGKVIDRFLKVRGRDHITKHERKQIRGTLRCAQLELYRRQIAGYEDLKMASNGDVYSE